MSELYTLIYSIVKKIPPGRVATYGQVAAMTGNYRRSRIVGYAMAGCKDNNVPCHRVVRSGGNLAKTFGIIGPQLQRELLEAEGVTFTAKGVIDLKKHLWEQ